MNCFLLARTNQRIPPDQVGVPFVFSYLAPDSFVELDVYANILGAHHLLCKLLDLLHGARSTLLEGDAMQPLVEVDGVLTRSHRAFLALVFHHLREFKEAAKLVSLI